MTQRDVDAMRALVKQAGEGDLGAWLEAIDPHVRLYPRSEEPGVRDVYEGWDGVMEYLVNWYSQWEDYDFEPVEVLDAGDRVLVVLRERGVMERGGMEVEQDFSHSFMLREGRIAEWRMYDSHEQALEALGLSG